MKRTMIATLAAVAAVLAAAYLTGADGTAQAAQGTGLAGAQTPHQTKPVPQVMQQPMVETEECTEGYILLMPCPVCHTCPVCQSNCGTAHALKCCLGNRKPAYNAASCGTSADGASGVPQKQHIMTNKAEAVKHAAGHTSVSPQAQTGGAVVDILTIDAD